MAVEETDLVVGHHAIEAYSRLNYTMWYALAEFIDNSTQSRSNYGSIIDDVLADEGTPLVVTIDHNRLTQTITISDNSIGMTKADLLDALKIAVPTKDSKGRSKYGMGMKTAACWIGRRWTISTVEWGSGERVQATVDLDKIINDGAKIIVETTPLESTSEHGTTICISGLNRVIQRRTEETIREFLSSMYRFDLRGEHPRLRIVYNDTALTPPEEGDLDTDPEGKIMKQEFATVIAGRNVKGWFGVLKEGFGTRKHGGFSLFQEKRQIRGFPDGWRPKSIFGGSGDEASNTLVAQRLTGEIELDGFAVSHTKDAILWHGTEDDDLEKFLLKETDSFRRYARKRRGKRANQWNKQKVLEILEGIGKELEAPEVKDVIDHTVLPPLETILNSNENLAKSLTSEEQVKEYSFPGFSLVVSWTERSEHEPYLVMEASAEPNKVHVILNGLHPYYAQLQTVDAMDECMRQFIYDAAAQYRAEKLTGKVSPAAVLRMKNELLKAKVLKMENEDAAEQEAHAAALTTNED